MFYLQGYLILRAQARSYLYEYYNFYLKFAYVGLGVEPTEKFEKTPKIRLNEIVKK